MFVAGSFVAIVTNTTFAKLNSKLDFTYMTLTREKFNHSCVNLTLS